MTTEQMRIEVAKAYPSESWKKKVKAMNDNQVIAVYRRLQREGKIK